MSGSSVTVRRLGSVPERTSSQTWHAIADLIAAPGSCAHATLLRAAGVASMLIAEAYTQHAPIIATPGTGLRVRIYTVHGADAQDAMVEEMPLTTWPTADPGWAVSLPCETADVDFASTALAQVPEVTVRDAALGLGLDDQESAFAAADRTAALRVDTSWLENQ